MGLSRRNKGGGSFFYSPGCPLLRLKLIFCYLGLATSSYLPQTYTLTDFASELGVNFN